MRIAIKIWREMFNIFKKYPKVLIPFVIVALIDTIILYVLYLAPQRPVAYLLAPPIRVFFGEKFLHYPLNIFILPKLLYYANVLSGAVIGVLMSGAAIGMIKDSCSNNKPEIFSNLVVALKRYFSLLTVWIIVFFLSFSFIKSVKLLNLGRDAQEILAYVFYFVIIFINLIFVYVIPALIIEKRNIISSIKRGLSFLKVVFFPTLLLVVVPTLLYLPVLFLKQNFIGLANRLFPEAIALVLGAGIIVSLIIDAFITTSATILFLKKKEG